MAGVQGCEEIGYREKVKVSVTLLRDNSKTSSASLMWLHISIPGEKRRDMLEHYKLKLGKDNMADEIKSFVGAYMVYMGYENFEIVDVRL